MKLAVFGGTGKTGLALIEQAISRGHSIRTLVRPSSTTPLPPAVEMVSGNAQSETTVDETIAGADAVISLLGAALSASFDPAHDIASRAIPHILKAMDEHGIRRLIVISAFGAGESLTQISPAFRLVMKTALLGIYRDKNAMEPWVLRSSLDWTLLRPTNLTNGPLNERARIETGKVGALSKISRSNVAKFVLDELEANRLIRRAVIINEAK